MTFIHSCLNQHVPSAQIHRVLFWVPGTEQWARVPAHRALTLEEGGRQAITKQYASNNSAMKKR